MGILCLDALGKFEDTRFSKLKHGHHQVVLVRGQQLQHILDRTRMGDFWWIAQSKLGIFSKKLFLHPPVLFDEKLVVLAADENEIVYMLEHEIFERIFI